MLSDTNSNFPFKLLQFFYLGFHYFRVNMFFFVSCNLVYPFYQSCNRGFIFQHFSDYAIFLEDARRPKRPILNNK